MTTCDITLLEKTKLLVKKNISDIRRNGAEHSLRAFLEIYLPSYCTVAPCPMHEELFGLLETASVNRDARIAIAAPRGYAKTTLVSTAYLLWSVCYQKENYIMLVSATGEQASDILSHVKKELESNEAMIQDFPEACEVPGVPPKAPRWRKNEIITRNQVKVSAVGEGTSIRGKKFKQHRPTLILVDDLEIRERVFSEEQRAKTKDWFNGALSKMGSSKTNIVVVGTILHYDSLLCTLTSQKKAPGWNGRIYRAVIDWPSSPDLWSEWENIYRRRTEYNGANGPKAALAYFNNQSDAMLEGTQVLWPECESFYELMVSREREERSTFDSEKQNDPVNAQDCLFPENEMQFWEDRFGDENGLLNAVGKDGWMLGACDPSLGRTGRAGAGGARAMYGGGDYSAIIMLMYHFTEGKLYVLDADIRRRRPDAIIEDILTLYRYRDCQAFGLENNGFQELLGGQLQERAKQLRMAPSLLEITSHSDKRARVQRLQPMIRAGQILFSRRHTLLLEQLRQFPMGSHDDGPDALEMAVQMAESYSTYLDDENARESMRQMDLMFKRIAYEHGMW